MSKFFILLMLTLCFSFHSVVKAENSSFENRYKPSSKGPTGPRGPTGPTGPAGAPGRNCDSFSKIAFGEISFQNAPMSQIIPPGMPGVTLTLFDSSGISEKTIPDISAGTITIEEPGTYMISFNMNSISEAKNSLFFIAALDGVVQTNAMVGPETLGNVANASFSGIVRTETPNVALSITVRQFTAEPVNITCRTNNLNVLRIK